MDQREDILQQALALPLSDRAFVIAALQESLPTDAAGRGSSDAISGDDFLAELRRRSEAYRNGTMAARPAAEILAELRAKSGSRLP